MMRSGTGKRRSSWQHLAKVTDDFGFADQVNVSDPEGEPSDARYSDDEAEGSPATLELTINRTDEFKATVTWEVWGENVQGLQIIEEYDATILKAAKVVIHEIDDVTANKAPEEREPFKLDLHKTAKLYLIAKNAAPTATKTVKGTGGRLHEHGGPMRELLANRELVKTTLSIRKRVEEAYETKKLRTDLLELTMWIYETLIPKEETTKDTQMAAVKLRETRKVVYEAVDEAISWAISEMPEQIAALVPYVGQILAGVKAVKNLGHAGIDAINARSLFGAEDMIIRNRIASARPQTPELLFARLGSYYRDQAYGSLADAAGRFAEFGLRFTPIGGSTIGAASNAVRVTDRVLSNYREARRAELTNWMLRKCQETGDPDDYYYTIKNGHSAVACYLIKNYTKFQIERRSQQKKGETKRSWLFWKVSIESEIAKVTADLKIKAMNVQEKLRFKILEPGDEPADSGSDDDVESL